MRDNKGFCFILQYRTTCAPGLVPFGGADMKHHFKHKFVDEVMKEEIGQLLICNRHWSNNRLIDKVDGFLSPLRRDRMIENWIVDGILKTMPAGAYQWGGPSKAPTPLQREHWVELPGTPFYLSHEVLFSNFFNEVKELCRKFKSSVTRGATIVGNQRMWKAFSRDLVEGVCSPDIILITDSSEKVKWSQVISAMEVKWKDSPKLFWSALDQLSDKATFIFHHQPQCQWFPSLSLCGTALHMSVFTHGGSVHSLPLNVGADPKLFSKVMNYFMESELSWLGYDTYIFCHATLQIWDDKPHWLEDEDEDESGDEEFSLVGNLHRSIGVLFVFESYILLTPTVRSVWQRHVGLLKTSKEQDHGDRSDRECAEKLDGVYCRVHNLYWDDMKSLQGITIMEDHMHPSIGLFSKSPLPHMSVTSICAAMIPAADLPRLSTYLQKIANLKNNIDPVLLLLLVEWTFCGLELHEKCFTVLHRDVSDGNSMLLLHNISAEFAIPPCPEKAPEGWTSFSYSALVFSAMTIGGHRDLNSVMNIDYPGFCNARRSALNHTSASDLILR
ncbi:uncharacterized protein HD556DRAFT_1438745 [Suillus plorans]|uniref:Fungal-type protein kinase domain-containing protein n=1 Tax=Suillus plorans TaxID=116603 RepID=A0A9P7DQJ1_9AGAM|nr:uncharacterized protein HD556DRAFT_1438745 [Suillus plorans]KAG1800744.1 hypothetical protein HD556DRAFT_1438745 [Suillus plorans]